MSTKKIFVIIFITLLMILGVGLLTIPIVLVVLLGLVTEWFFLYIIGIAAFIFAWALISEEL